MRTRNVKPGFFKDEALAQCRPEARILFLGLSCLADKDGRLKEKLGEIKADVFPHHEYPIAAMLEELSAQKLIVRYQWGDLKLIQVCKDADTFRKHARPHPDERSEGFPPPAVKPHGESREFPASCAVSLTHISTTVADVAEKKPDQTSDATLTADSQTLVDSLVERGLPAAVAKQLVQAADPALIREVLPYHAEQKWMRNPVGVLRRMIERPEDFGFQATTAGWRRPQAPLPTGEDSAQRAARLAAEQTRQDQLRQDAERDREVVAKLKAKRKKGGAP